MQNIAAIVIGVLIGVIAAGRFPCTGGPQRRYGEMKYKYYYVALAGRPAGEVYDRWGAAFHVTREEAEETVTQVRSALETETGKPFLFSGIWDFDIEDEAYEFLAYRLGISKAEALDASIDAKEWAFTGMAA